MATNDTELKYWLDGLAEKLAHIDVDALDDSGKVVPREKSTDQKPQKSDEMKPTSAPAPIKIKAPVPPTPAQTPATPSTMQEYEKQPVQSQPEPIRKAVAKHPVPPTPAPTPASYNPFNDSPSQPYSTTTSSPSEHSHDDDRSSTSFPSSIDNRSLNSSSNFPFLADAMTPTSSPAKHRSRLSSSDYNTAPLLKAPQSARESSQKSLLPSPAPPDNSKKSATPALNSDASKAPSVLVDHVLSQMTSATKTDSSESEGVSVEMYNAIVARMQEAEASRARLQVRFALSSSFSFVSERRKSTRNAHF